MRVVSISGLHDLTPLLNTKMNLEFGLDVKQAKLLSPAFQNSVVKTAVTCWVGGDEMRGLANNTHPLFVVVTGEL